MSKEKNVLIIGGGIAGVTAAVALAQEGFDIHLVERSPCLGGQIADFCCKAGEKCNSCSLCLAQPQFELFPRLSNKHLYANTEIVGVSGNQPPYEVALKKRPFYIDDKQCIQCGLCAEICPEKAIRVHASSLAPSSYHILREACLLVKGGSCGKCRDICPCLAINLDEKPQEWHLKADTILVTTGYEPYDAREKTRFGYGRLPSVITARDLEEHVLRQGGLPLTAAGEHPRRMAFIQCVGSREPVQGRNYCSKVCCAYALRMARMIRYRCVETEVTFFYIDIQTFGRECVSFMDACRNDPGIHMVKGIPGCIEAQSDGLVLEYEDIEEGRNKRDRFDLAVLSIGMTGRKDSSVIADFMGLERGEGGFFTHGHQPGRGQGIFTAGSCGGPMDIPSTMLDARAAAARMIQYIRE